MKYEKISIIIPTHNRIRLLKNCIDSLLRQNYPKTDYEIIIVNDNSSDGTAQYINGLNNKIIRIVDNNKNNKNLGPSIAKNIGIKYSRYEILAFIDDDCRADKNWLKNISKFLMNNQEQVALMGKLIAPKNTNISGMAWSYRFNTATKYMITSEIKDINVVKSEKNNIKYIDMLGANCVIRKKVFKDIGIFWNRPYGEDRDLKYRIQKKGHKIVYRNDMIVEHDLNDSLFRALIKEFRYGRHEYYVRKKWEKNYYIINGKSYSSKMLPVSSLKNFFDIIKSYGLIGCIVYFRLLVAHILSSTGFYFEKYVNIKIFHKTFK